MPASTELRHRDFEGLRLIEDPVHDGALVARNVELPKPGRLDKRPGYRRVNQKKYSGAIWVIDDLQRICDYGKIILIADDEVNQHDEPDYIPPVDPFFDPAWSPVVHVSADPSNGVVPLSVQFSSAGSFDPDGGALTYDWDFGDGSPHSNDPNPAHVYSMPGIYPAVLTVTNPEGKTASDGLNITGIPALLLVAKYAEMDWSDNDGVGWHVSAGVSQYVVHGLVKGNDVILAIYSAGPAKFTFARAPDQGKTFAPTGVMVGGWTQRQGALAMTGTGRLLLAGNPGRKSDDFGATWLPTAMTAPLIVSGGGQVVFGAKAVNAGTPAARIDVTRSNDNGDTEAVIGTIPNPGLPVFGPAVLNLFYCGNGVLIMSASWAPAQYQYWWRSADNGAHWTAFLPPWQPVPLPSPYSALAVSIGVLGTDVLVLDGQANPAQIWPSQDNGVTWGAPTNLGSDVGAPQSYQKVLAHAAGWYVLSGNRIYKSAGVLGPFVQIALAPWAAGRILLRSP